MRRVVTLQLYLAEKPQPQDQMEVHFQDKVWDTCSDSESQGGTCVNGSGLGGRLSAAPANFRELGGVLVRVVLGKVQWVNWP